MSKLSRRSIILKKYLLKDIEANLLDVEAGSYLYQTDYHKKGITSHWIVTKRKFKEGDYIYNICNLKYTFKIINEFRRRYFYVVP